MQLMKKIQKKHSYLCIALHCHATLNSRFTLNFSSHRFPSSSMHFFRFFSYNFFLLFHLDQKLMVYWSYCIKTHVEITKPNAKQRPNQQKENQTVCNAFSIRFICSLLYNYVILKRYQRIKMERKKTE